MDKNKIIKYALCVGFGILAIIYFVLSNKNDSYEDILTNEIVIQNTMSEQNVEKEKIKIYITGEVKKPGVIEVDEGARIDDVINKAEGLTDEADLTNINLAYEVSDGEKIYIPNKLEENKEEIELNENINISNSGKININKANISELTKIPGVGSSTAEKIVSYREENGKFKSIEDIKKVSGIGEAKFDSIKDYISTK